MKIICSRDLLSNAIGTVQKAVSPRAARPILEGILFEATDQIKLTGYDEETGIESTLPADIQETGSVVIASRLLGEVVRKLPEDIVRIQMDDHLMITIESGTSVFKLRGQSAQDYPKIPIIEEAKILRVPQKKLLEMIRQTTFSASSDDSRPILNGVNVVYEDNSLTFVAVDGFRLGMRREEVEGAGEALQFIVPAKALNEVARILPDKESEIAINYSHNHILFDGDHSRLVSRLIRGEFMNYRTLVPQTTESSFVVDRGALLAACERASLIIESESKRFPVTFLSVDEETLKISSRTDVGTTDEDLAMNLTGKRFDMDFNPRFFIEILRVVNDEKVRIDFAGTLGPAVVRPVEGDTFTYIVLPLRR